MTQDNNPIKFVEKIKTAIRNPKLVQMLIAVVVMAIISLSFFHPDAIEGNTLRQYDMLQGQAIGEETHNFLEQTGEKSWWTNSLFGGMPTFQISPTYSSNSLFNWISTIYGLGLPSPANLLFMMMFGFMILMMAMNVKWQYGLIGAIAWGFSTYFIIIIGAGHIWKFVTLCYIPPTIAGIIMAYRGRMLMGSALAALFAMMQISSNHIQMSYYFLFVIVALVIAFFIIAYRKHQIAAWGKATGMLALAAILAVCANLPNLYNTYEYSKETIRGKSTELTYEDQNSSGKSASVDKNYITQYSYGRAETFTLFIPNVKGGASAKPVNGQMQAMSLGDLEEAEDMVKSGTLDSTSSQFLQYISQYFGEPESTNGPIYVGVIIFALFIAGCVIVKGPVKWALLVMTIISILLALGRNCMWFTDFFIDYIPMYSKFRTVESILVIAEFTIPVLAILALQKIITDPKKYKEAVCWSFGAVAFFCLLGILAPGVYGSVITPNDENTSAMITQQLTAQGYDRETVRSFSLENPTIYHAIRTLRRSMIQSDALRSIIYLALSFIALVVLYRGKIKAIYVTVFIGALILADLYSVNKRYLSHESFVGESMAMAEPFPMTPADQQILADTTTSYRVMDIQRFWQPGPSYRHKAIGGYHAAKLTRYQDLIDCHLGNITTGRPSEADMNVLNMLNAKYIVTSPQQAMLNPDALGNAWFVDELEFVKGADAEMDALDTLDPASEAVADEKFKDVIKGASPREEGDTIFLTKYAPNRLTYHSESNGDRLAVFSEVYFPYGWHATIDGKSVNIGRVNYLLRAMNIPAGKHTVEMWFDPTSIHTTVSIATCSVIIIYLMLGFAIFLLIKNYRPTTEEDKWDE